jgi:hypothetical protein
MSKKSESARERDGETEQKSCAVFSVVVQLKKPVRPVFAVKSKSET